MREIGKVRDINEAISSLMYYAKECKALRNDSGLSCEQLDKMLSLKKCSISLLEKMADEMPCFKTVEKVISYVNNDNVRKASKAITSLRAVR